MAGRPIVHMEIVSENLEATGKFYTDAFGWNVQSDNPMNYYMFQTSAGQGGGFVTPSPSTGIYPEYKSGQVLLYIGSDDIEADLAKIESLGGKILSPKFEIPETGWMAVFQEPGGSRLALYTPMQPQQGQ